MGQSGSFGVHLYQKAPKWVKKRQSCAHFLLERLRDSIENYMVEKGSFGVRLYEKEQKFVKKWLSYGHFLPERLSDSIENHMRQKGNLCCLFVPKMGMVHSCKNKRNKKKYEIIPYSAGGRQDISKDSRGNLADINWIIQNKQIQIFC